MGVWVFVWVCSKNYAETLPDGHTIAKGNKEIKSIPRAKGPEIYIERESERERQTDRQTDRENESETETDTEIQR